MSSRSASAERLPAAAVRIWPAGEAADDAEPAPVPGLVRLGPGLFAVVPTAGQPAIFDLAVLAARRVLESARHRRPRVGSRALVWPATFSLETRLADDPTLAALERQPPDLRRNGVYLAGQAGNLLESGWALHEGGAWRAVARPALAARLAELAGAPLAVVRGPLGVGKSRAVSEWLRGRGAPTLWLRPDLGAAGLPLPVQLVRQTALLSRSLVPASRGEGDAWEQLRRAAYSPQALAEALALVTWRWLGQGNRPLTVVLDGMEAVDPQEREFLSRLLELPQLGRSYRLTLVGREGEWASDWPDATAVAVPPFTVSEAAELARERGAALGLPGPVAD